MAIARTGVYVDDYLEYSSTLAGDLQRILSTMHELDERAHGIMGQTKEQIKYLLGVPSHGLDRSNMVDDDESSTERMQKDIETSQDNALSLCTEKVLLARQAYDLIESHIKRLDEDLGQFADDLKQEGKIPPDEPPILPPFPLGSRDDKRRPGFNTPQAAKKFRDREWEMERGMDFDLMPPPGSNKKAIASMDVEQMIDPNEPTYCICHQVSYGDMIACDNENASLYDGFADMAESINGNGASTVTSSFMLHGRVAIVTGGAGGIGSAVSKHLASLGARVAVAYVGDPAPAQKLVGGINSRHAEGGGSPRAIAVEADVSDAAQVRALFDAAAAAFGGEIHVVVTAAAVLDYSYPPLAKTSEASYDAAFGTNARGTFLCYREAANRLARDGRGRIVTFSSSGVGSLRPGYAAYAASKAAVETMTRILARELRGTGITANAVAPGSTATPMFYNGKTEEEAERYIAEAPLGRLGLPEDIAPLVGFLASDAGGWVNAQVLRCNGGTV